MKVQKKDQNAKHNEQVHRVAELLAIKCSSFNKYCKMTASQREARINKYMEAARTMVAEMAKIWEDAYDLCGPLNGYCDEDGMYIESDNALSYYLIKRGLIKSC